MNLDQLTTERRNPRAAELDSLAVTDLLLLMNDEDAHVAPAVRAVVPQVARAVEAVAAAFRAGGRLVYAGAGTSGRLGVLDSVECPPTFGTDPAQVVGLIAGGAPAIMRAVEGAEDDPTLAARELDALGLEDRDVVVGVAASGRTPYVIGALDHARAIGAATVSVACNPRAAISDHADIAIEVDAGPEILTGSTRLKAGTAQKLVLNMISTAAMVQTGKVYGNLMVDVRPTNDKLLDRARRIVVEATGCDTDAAVAALAAADGHAKTAIVCVLAGCDAAEARTRLARAGGFVREALATA